MVMEREESASSGHMEPGVGGDEHAPQGRRVVAVQLTDHPHHLVPAELLELLHAAIRPAEYLKFAFEYPAIALRERVGVRVRRAFGRPPQKQLAQLSVQCIAVVQLRKSERDGEIRNYLRHAPGSPINWPRDSAVSSGAMIDVVFTAC